MMVKKYVIVNEDNGKYFTGKYWYEFGVWDRNITEAELYNSMSLINEVFTLDEVKDVFEKIKYVTIKTIYVNETE